MNRKFLTLIAICSSLLFTIQGCSKKVAENGNTKTATSSSAPASDNVNEVTESSSSGIVCIWDGVPVREEAKKNGKFISSISLGEVVEDLNKSITDESDKNREYLKVRLSDGKEGWAPTYGLIKQASTSVIKTDASLYKRPDLLTITNVKFSPMEFIAVSNEKEDWIFVTGEQKKKTGWIKKDAVSSNKEDVAMAIFINKKMAEKDGKNEIEKYKTIVADAPFPNSIFIENLNKKITETEAAVQNAIETKAPASETDTDSDNETSDEEGSSE
jgi:hypothetical protein